MTLKVGIAGCGTIGRRVALELDAGGVRGATLGAITSRSLERAARFAAKLDCRPPVVELDEMVGMADLVIEAAPADAMDAIATATLSAGKDLMALSGGALLERDDLFALAERNGATIYVPSGAIAGLDGVAGAVAGRIDSLTMITRKPPDGLAGAPGIEAAGIDLGAVSEPTVVYEGPASGGVQAVPGECERIRCAQHGRHRPAPNRHPHIRRPDGGKEHARHSGRRRVRAPEHPHRKHPVAGEPEDRHHVRAVRARPAAAHHLYRAGGDVGGRRQPSPACIEPGRETRKPMNAGTLSNNLEAARVELLDMGLRNKLLSWRPSRRYGVEIQGEDPATLFDRLVRGTVAFGFEPKPDDKEDAPRSRRRNWLMTGVGRNELQTRLLRTSAQARALLEEQGVNTLFLALGMIEWYESDSSETPRHAPMLLVPVSLARESIRAGFTIAWTGEDLGSNASFAGKTRVDFGLAFPIIDENEIDDIDVEVDAYFGDVERAIAAFPRWKARRDMAVVDFFSFSKLLMHADLDPANWQEDGDAAESGVLTSLLGDENFDDGGSSIGDGARIDDHLRPEDVHHVIDADSSQALAILDVGHGRNLVIQGPPGTGKSQTITNIIADAIADGKTTLFVAEKMAALEVVKRKLDEIHLGVACLELHSHKSTKRIVLDELQRTLTLGEPSLAGIEDDFATLGRARDALNSHADAVNAPVGDTGVSPFEAYGAILEIAERLGDDFDSLPRQRIAALDQWNQREYSERREVAANLQSALARTGPLNKHTFGDSRLRVVLPTDLVDIRAAGSAGTDAVASVKRDYDRLANALGVSDTMETLDPPETVTMDDVQRLLASGKMVLDAPDLACVNVTAPEWAERTTLVSDVVETGVRRAEIRVNRLPIVNWDIAADDLRAAREALTSAPRGIFSFTAGLRGAVRNARALLRDATRDTVPKDVDAQIALLDAMIAEREAWKFLNDNKAIADAILSDGWRGDRTAWADVRAACEWTLKAHRAIREGETHSTTIWGGAAGTPASVARREDLRGATSSLDDLSRRLAVSAESVRALLDLSRSPLESAKTGLDGLETFFAACRDSANDAGDVARVNLSLDAVSDAGLEALTALARDWDNASERLVDALDASRYEAIVARAMSNEPDLAGFDGDAHERRVEQFGRMDALALEHNCARVAHAHYERLPRGAGGGQSAF